MEKPEIEITGLNADVDLYYTYLEEYYHGITDLSFDEWKEEILADDYGIDWELWDMALELAENENKE
jgi:hypothetical protein